MRVLVTGSEGGIGRRLVPSLLAANHTMRTLDVVESTMPGNVEHRVGDLRDSALLREAVQGMDAVLHLGAISGDILGAAETVLSVNVQGTWNLLLACAEAGVRQVVHFSSINALGCVGGQRPPLQLPINDAYPHHPLTPYQLSKHLAEEVCRSFADTYGIGIVCLRPVWVALPEQHYDEWLALEAGKREDRFRGELWAYVDVRDVCDAALRALATNPPGYAACLLSAADTLVDRPTAELLARHFAATPWRGERTYLNDRPYRTLIDWSDAEQLLGWRPAWSWRQHAKTEGNLWI